MIMWVLFAAFGGPVWASRSTTGATLATSNATDLQFPVAAFGTSATCTEGWRIARSSDGLFYVNVDVNGQMIRFLIDTGASRTVLGSADARLLRLVDDRSAPTNVFTAGGLRTAAWRVLHHVQVGGRTFEKVPVVVLPSELPAALLGQDLLSRLGALRFEGDWLEVHCRIGKEP